MPVKHKQTITEKKLKADSPQHGFRFPQLCLLADVCVCDP